MNILLLGGYAFLGRALIEAAQARGHAVSAFNRGSRPVMRGVEQFTGDRNAPAFPAGRNWDVAIDTSGQAPKHTRAAAELLRDRIGTYIFTSSISVYPSPLSPGADERTAVATMNDGADPDDPKDLENYGARKALCEAALETAMPGRALIVRPGFIIGPYDYTDRFSTWIERAARAGPLLVPGDPSQPVQVIDVRDLARWMIALAEDGVTGIFNATGAERPYTLLEVARTCLEQTSGAGPPVVIPKDELKPFGIEGWEQIPMWIDPEDYPLMQVDVRRAVNAGLRFRPLSRTIADIYAWMRESKRELKNVVPADLEAAAITRFRAR